MSGNRDNTTRTKARRRAVEILYEAEARDSDPREVLATKVDAGHPPVRPFTVELVQGVGDNLHEIDEVLRGSLSSGWTLERMPRLDRALARMAAFELAHTDTDRAVVAREAGDLAAELSTEQSPAFITALVDRVDHTLRARADSPDPTDIDAAGADAEP